MVHKVASKDDLEAQLKTAGDKLVVIDFFATWCGPCKTIAPVLEELSGSLGGAVVFLKVDVDEQQDLAGQYQVTSMPTFILLKAGKEVAKFTGANEAKLREAINSNK